MDGPQDHIMVLVQDSATQAVCSCWGVFTCLIEAVASQSLVFFPWIHSHLPSPCDSSTTELILTRI